MWRKTNQGGNVPNEQNDKEPSPLDKFLQKQELEDKSERNRKMEKQEEEKLRTESEVDLFNHNFKLIEKLVTDERDYIAKEKFAGREPPKIIIDRYKLLEKHWQEMYQFIREQNSVFSDKLSSIGSYLPPGVDEIVSARTKNK